MKNAPTCRVRASILFGVLLAYSSLSCFADSDDSEPMGGAECASNSECDSGAQCMMGVCQVPCASRDGCASNEACTEGICVVAEGTTCNASDPCADGFTCIGEQCAPLLGPGGACAGESQCASGACVDGVCCNRACDATCESCLNVDTGLADGVCALATAGRDPGERCGDLSSCDVGGGCKLDDGVSCALAEDCGSALCVDGVCCDSGCDGLCRSCLGTVSGGRDGVCTFLASGTERVFTEPAFEDCPGVQACDGSGACFAKESGASCAGDDECASGFCTDGVCCVARCSEACRECTTGTCLNVTSGSDPGTCAGCFADGSCDGKAVLEACTSPDECGSGICSDGQCRLANGAVCNEDTECENACVLGQCAPSAPLFGQCDSLLDCQSGLECTSGFCLVPNDGVCVSNDQCSNVCIGETCANVSTTNGTCDVSDNADCEAGLNCVATECLIPQGSTIACDTNAQCEEPACVFGVCGPLVTQGGACESTSQCEDPGNLVCCDDVGTICSGNGGLRGDGCRTATGHACSRGTGCPGSRICGSDFQLFGSDRCYETEVFRLARLRIDNSFPELTINATLECMGRDRDLVSQTLSLAGGDPPNDTLQAVAPVECALGSVLRLECQVVGTPSESGFRIDPIPEGGTEVGTAADTIQTLSNNGTIRHILVEGSGLAICQGELD